ncbi:hypothetical protein U0070_012233, partial [Myodes glareolus]
SELLSLFDVILVFWTLIVLCLDWNEVDPFLLLQKIPEAVCWAPGHTPLQDTCKPEPPLRIIAAEPSLRVLLSQGKDRQENACRLPVANPSCLVESQKGE